MLIGTFCGIIETPRSGKLLGTFNGKDEFFPIVLKEDKRKVFRLTGYVNGHSLTNRCVHVRKLAKMLLKGKPN
jgi:hypothetical protein